MENTKKQNETANVWEVNDTERIAMEYEQFFNQADEQCFSIEGTRAMFYSQNSAADQKEGK